jgi:hypothetical protein
MDLSAIPILDHHAHPLLRPEETADPTRFRRWFTESTDPTIHANHVPHTLFFKSGLRWLAGLLDCAPTLEAVLKARADQPYDQWVERLFTEANIEMLLCDYGYQSDKALKHQEMKSLLPCAVQPILRLETLAEQLIVEHETFEAMTSAFFSRVRRARAGGYVAFKSIAAYRTGLDISIPSEREAAAAFDVCKKVAKEPGRLRLAHQPLNDYLLRIAIEQAAAQSLPLQFHTGFGDRDADLRQANPLLLKPLIEQTEVQIVLLHAGWPFYREAAHLAALYPHVWLDLSLAVPFATTGIPTMLADILGMAPFSKILYATDAFTMPEIYWLAARWGRWSLGRVLSEFVSDGFLDETAAYETAEMILNGNARLLYGIKNSSADDTD